jgi:hypothetical protein
MKKKYVSGEVITLILLLGGCRGGEDQASFATSAMILDINVTCEQIPTATNIENYITLQSGDVIVKDTDGAKISIYHDINGTKKVCLQTATAYIVRQPEGGRHVVISL